MLKRPSFKSRHPLLGSSLLALLIMASGSAANAQSDAADQVQIPDQIVDVEITGNSVSPSANTSGESTSGLCERPEPWLYANTYKEGEMASHGGKVWKVIKTTKGDMPGMNKPPFWEQVEDHCSAVSP